MKLSAYPITQRAVELAAQLARPELTRAPETVAGSSALPPTSSAPIDALKLELDRIRGALGQRAVDRLVAELPQAVIAALREIRPELPIEPGQSPYLAYKTKLGELRELELRAQELSEKAKYEPVLSTHFCENLKVLSELKDREALKAANPQASESQILTWERSAIADHERLNRALEGYFPGLPPEQLCQGPYGAGPGQASVADVLARIARLQSKGSARATLPNYAAVCKDIAALEAHLKQHALHTPDQVIELKAELADPAISIRTMYDDVLRLLEETVGFGGSSGMAASSTLRRDEVRTRVETTSESEHAASGTSRSYNAAGWQTSSTSSDSVGSSSSHSVREVAQEILRPAARQYEVVLAPPAGDCTRLVLSKLRPLNSVSRLEVSILADRLLSARRVYEAMRAREPDSPYTLALKDWMEESVVKVSTQQQGDHVSHAVPVESLQLGNLRTDLLRWGTAGLVSPELIEVVREELAIGSPTGSGQRLRSLNSLASI